MDRNLSVLLVALASCTPAKRSDDARIRIAVVGELAPLGPLTQSTFSMVAQDWVFEPVVRPDPSSLGSIASTVERLDFRHGRVLLNGAARFSDGVPVTTSEVIASLMRAGLSTAPAGKWLEFSAPAEGPAMDALLVGALVSRDSPQGPLGTGPFVVVEQKPNRTLLRRRQIRAGRISEIEVLTYASSRDAFAHVLRGDADVLIDIDPRLVELLEGVKRLHLVSSAGIHILAATVNGRRVDPRERAALVRSIPAHAIADLAYGEHCRFSSTLVPAGYPSSGGPLNVLTVNDGQSERAGLVMVRALGKRAGRVVQVSAREANARLFRHDFDIAISRMLVDPPSMLASWFRTGAPGNFSGYSNPVVDAALDAGNWAAARAEMERDPPVAFICTPDRLAVFDVRIKNARLGPYGLLETLPEWEVEP